MVELEAMSPPPFASPWLSKLSIANFRRFDQLTVRLPQPGQDLVIYGPSGSGKTQICWALLLFLRAHNSCEVNSKYAVAPFITLTDQAEVSQLLNPSLKGMASWQPLVRDPNVNVMGGYPHAVFTGRFLDGRDISCSLRVNGVLQLDLPQLSLQVPAKIAFAFAVPATFSDVESAIAGAFEAQADNDLGQVDACLNNFGSQTRGLFQLLPKPSQQAVQDNLSDLFGPTKVEKTKRDLLVTQNGVQLEAMFYGAALQKVLSTLILLEFLSQQHNRPIKFLIVEEPEAMLHSSLVEPFWAKLRKLCQERSISLIATTHNAAIISSARNQLPLSGKIAGETALQDALEQLGINLDESTPVQQSLLFVEGSDDVYFIKKYFHFDRLVFEETQSNSKFAGVAKADFNAVVLRVLGGKMVYLLDRDFAEKTSVRPSATTYTWELPMIESYLILSQLCFASTDQRQALLKTYFELPAASDKFFHKIYQTIPKKQEDAVQSTEAAPEVSAVAESVFAYMQRRMQEYARVSTSEDLSVDESALIDYLEYIDGHLWVEKVVKDFGKSTAAWINATQSLHPTVVEMLRAEAAVIAKLLDVTFELK